ncbi:Zinc finger protein PLAG1, partial [Frankliniella fusca]
SDSARLGSKARLSSSAGRAGIPWQSGARWLPVKWCGSVWWLVVQIATDLGVPWWPWTPNSATSNRSGLGSVLTRRLRKLRHKADDMPPPTLELSHDEEAGDEDPTNAFVRALRSWAARKMGASACSATAAAAGGDAEEEKPSACARCGDMVDPGAARRGAHVCRDVEDAGPAGARLAESLVFRMTVCMQCDTAVEWDKLCRCFQADGDELEPPCGELVEADEHGAGDMPRLSPQDTPSAAYKTRSSHHADEDKDGPALSRKIAEHKTYQNKKPMSNVMNAVENELHSNPPLQTRLSGIRALAKEQKTEPAPIASLATDYVKVEYLVSPTKGLQTEEPVLSKAPQTVAVRSEPSRLKTEPVATPPCVVIDDDDEETDEPVLIEAPLTHADKMKRPLLETGRAPSPPCMVIVDDEEEVAPQQRSSAPADLRGRKSATVDDSAQSCLLCLLSAESGADATGLTTDLLDAHMGDVHGGVAGDAFCSSCLRRFRDEATLRAHMSRSHPGGPSGLAAPAPALSFSCSSCGF